MKKLGVALLGLVVVLIAAVLIGPSFVDWNAQKGRISAEVEKLTGRALTIEGDISLALLPAPALSADKVRLANVSGGSAPSMVELEALKIRIAPLPLIQGDVQVKSVALVRPTILIEVLEDGRKNWEIVPPAETDGAGGAAAGAADGDGDGFGGQIRLESLRISDGTLIYRDAPAGREERIAGLDAEIAAGSLNGPFAVTGNAVVRAIDTEFEVTVGQLIREGATPLTVNLGLPKAAVRSTFNGAMSLHPAGTSLRGRIKAEGENLAALIALLPGQTVAPAALRRPFVVDTELSADPRQINAARLNVRLGESAVEGDVQLELGPPVHARVDISASRLDLDKLLAANATTEGAGASEPAQSSPESNQAAEAQAPTPAAAWALPQDVDGALEVSIDALVYRRQVIRQVLLSATLSEGRMQLGQALALLPGGSDVSLTGSLGPDATGGGPELRFNGHLEAASDNLRGIFEWLGVDVAAVPAERLRRMSLSATVDATRHQATLSGIDLRVDVSRVTGGIAIALRQRPGFGIGLALDKIDLDAYLPEPAESTPQSQQTDAEPASQSPETTGAQPEPATAQAASGPLAALGGFDANLDLKVGSASLRGVTARELHLDATLQQGALTLREALVGDLAGSRARVAGTIAGLTASPSVDATVELSVPDPVRLAKLADLSDDVLARLGPLDLAGSVEGALDRVSFDAELSALGGRFGAAGTAQPLAGPPGFDVTVSARHQSLAELAGALAPGLALDPALGGVDLSGRLAGTPAKVQVSDLSGTLGPAALTGGFTAEVAGPRPVVSGADLGVAVKHPDLAGLLRAVAPEVRLGTGLGGVDVRAHIAGGSEQVQVSELAGRLGPAELSGGLSADLTGETPRIGGIDLAFALTHPSLAELARAVRPEATLDPGLGGVDLKGRVTGDMVRIEVADLNGRLGPTELSGTLGADLSGARPALRIDLATGELPLAAFGAAAPAEGGSGASSAGAAGNPAKAKGGSRWSSEPLDLSALETVDAEVKLQSKALVHGGLRLDKARLEAALEDGVLNLRKLNGTAYGGAVSVTGKVDVRETPEAGLAVTAIELDLARVLHDLAESDRVSGPLSLDASLNTRGRSEADLVSALAGNGEVTGTLQVQAKKEEQVGSILLGILGEKVREIRGVTDATNVLFNAFADAPAAVTGSFVVERGVARTQDLRVEGRQATALTQGTADLPAWQLDTRTDVFRAQDPNTPYLTVNLRGPLDAPNPRLSGVPLQRQPQQPAPTGQAPTGQAQPQQPAPQTAPEKLKPEDLLKEGLKKGLKGLFGN